MKKLIVFIALAGIAATAYAEMTMPRPNATELWNHIMKTSPYKEWENFPDHQGMQPGKAPHGPFHEVFTNKMGLTKGRPKPAGTIVVKENFTADKKLSLLTVMYKVKGYNPEGGDWFWVEYTPKGAILYTGKPRLCIGCHSVRKDKDYIMVSEH